MLNLTQTIVAALLALAPYSRQRPPPGWEETRAAYEARLRDIAEDIAAVSNGNREDAAALVGVSWHESGWAKDVDAGMCHTAWKGRCDGGKAASIFQLQDADPVRLFLFKVDRRAAAREALRRIRRSQRACAGNAAGERMAVYAGGVCGLLSARAAARSLDASIRKARDAMGRAAN